MNTLVVVGSLCSVVAVRMHLIRSGQEILLCRSTLLLCAALQACEGWPYSVLAGACDLIYVSLNYN